MKLWLFSMIRWFYNCLTYISRGKLSVALFSSNYCHYFDDSVSFRLSISQKSVRVKVIDLWTMVVFLQIGWTEKSRHSPVPNSEIIWDNNRFLYIYHLMNIVQFFKCMEKNYDWIKYDIWKVKYLMKSLCPFNTDRYLWCSLNMNSPP